jgi:GNAT superfamily N-acetyltransferase
MRKPFRIAGRHVLKSRAVIRTASPDDLPALRDLLGRANDAPYDIRAVAEEKCFGSGIAGVPVVRVFERDGRMAGAAVTCAKWIRILAVERDIRRQGIGGALAEDAESRGASVVAAEPGNYFTPGVPTTDDASLAFWRGRGYVEGPTTWNLQVSLQIVESLTTGTHDDSRSVRRAAHDETDRVLSFIEREFGRIWRFEASHAFDRTTPSLFISQNGGEITGFAAHEANNRGLGFFGPTGVAKSMRGRGIGCELLRASLADLAGMGYAQAVIPWTDALDFYRKCSGAEPALQFVAFASPRP